MGSESVSCVKLSTGFAATKQVAQFATCWRNAEFCCRRTDNSQRRSTCLQPTRNIKGIDIDFSDLLHKASCVTLVKNMSLMTIVAEQFVQHRNILISSGQFLRIFTKSIFDSVNIIPINVPNIFSIKRLLFLYHVNARNFSLCHIY